MLHTHTNIPSTTFTHEITRVLEALSGIETMLLLLLLSRFSRVGLCAAPETAAHQAPHPWDSPGKNTGVGCHFLLQCMKVKSESEDIQSYPTLSDPMDYQGPTRPLRPWDFPGKSTGETIGM